MARFSPIRDHSSGVPHLFRTDSHRARLCSRRYHADHSCDADDDPKNGQGAPQFVHAQRARGAFELKALGARRINLICRRVDNRAQAVRVDELAPIEPAAMIDG
jgi:hypothetical protein